MDFRCTVKLTNGKCCDGFCTQRVTLSASGVVFSVPVCADHKRLMDTERTAKKPDIFDQFFGEGKNPFGKKGQTLK